MKALPQKTFFNWSTGKDSALALYRLQRDRSYQVTQLLTSVNESFDRVSMHGVRRELLERQAAALNLPLLTIELPENPDMQLYEDRMSAVVMALAGQGFSYAAFGDIFLEDLRRYREEKLAVHGLKAVFPLWQQNTRQLMHEFIDAGFQAIVSCVNLSCLDASFAGRRLDRAFLADLPAGVDPCGENGEFHTFCFDGPVFQSPIAVKTGEKRFAAYPNPQSDGPAHTQTGFCFIDLLPD